MVDRTKWGYKHPNAYKAWLKEQDEVIMATAFKNRSITGLQSVVSVEDLSVALGRSISAIIERARILNVVVLTSEQINVLCNELVEEIKQREEPKSETTCPVLLLAQEIIRSEDPYSRH
jgi:hypothetical protein